MRTVALVQAEGDSSLGQAGDSGESEPEFGYG